MRKLEQLSFDNSYARLPASFYRRLDPTPMPAPYLVSFNADAAALLDLDPAEATRAEFAEYFIGNRLLPGSEPLAMLYAGHQFGHYVPQLGDGRAILLGEIKNRAGERWDVQLKGAGPTPFSRNSDGRAVLRSSIREYLCSEAMHGLGIPSTRALCIVGSDEEVYRETIETAAVLTRLAPSHVRFGSFEVFYYNDRHESLPVLADYVIAGHFPHLADAPDKYVRFLNEVVARTAQLMARWQAVGFSHGVMNTDNMSILGLTFDYGPFGFMDAYDPAYVCNHSDHHGRYAYREQPKIGHWNLSCLAQALLPIMPVEAAQAALDAYIPTYKEYYKECMGRKLGLTQAGEEDIALVETLLQLMHASHLDYTRLFRALSRFQCAAGDKNAMLRDQFTDRDAFDAWADSYRARLQREPGNDAERAARMNRVNPKYILRNYLAQNAIARAAQERDFTEVERLQELLRHPFDEHPEMESYAAPPPDWARQIEVSCSS
ncbi:MAG: protein adenylyltransferase SelO [Sulfuricaulis sp.]